MTERQDTYDVGVSVAITHFQEGWLRMSRHQKRFTKKDLSETEKDQLEKAITALVDSPSNLGSDT